ncbi:MAG: 2-C-methyl-D-erythritol 2,4-cyclodiphosphate synthase [Chloroflexi bacterium]|nr:2-C-methyl-D-erythritol 2,4-cyclodiphosphate synthase [Chloroflexota bacterium]
MSRRGALLVAAGRATRMGFDKLWVELRGRPVVAYGLELLARCQLDALVLVVAEPRLDQARALLAELGLRGRVCVGGERRRDSVARGLACLEACDWVVVHDAARPLAAPDLVLRGLEAARATGAAVPGVPIADTVKRVQGGRVVETLRREELWRIQTPQVFRRDLLARALAESDDDVGDEATLIERLGGEVRVFAGAEDNLKLTTPDDLRLAAALLDARGAMSQLRVGIGYDVHPFGEGRPLVLGGVALDYPQGLAGHSDGDALCHAIIDALLGAAAAGDIGGWFPSSEERYRGASSLELLARVRAALAERGWRVGNVDATVIAEQPRLAPGVPEMRQHLARALDVEVECVSVKATTTDRLGALGRGEGLAAQAVALLMKSSAASPQ